MTDWRNDAWRDLTNEPPSLWVEVKIPPIKQWPCWTEESTFYLRGLFNGFGGKTLDCVFLGCVQMFGLKPVFIVDQSLDVTPGLKCCTLVKFSVESPPKTLLCDSCKAPLETLFWILTSTHEGFHSKKKIPTSKQVVPPLPSSLSYRYLMKNFRDWSFSKVDI